MKAILIRLPDDLHRLLPIAAGCRRQSRTAYVVAAIRAAILRQASAKGGEAVAAALNASRER